MGRRQGMETRLRKVLIGLHDSAPSEKDLEIVSSGGRSHLCHAALLASASGFISTLLQDCPKNEDGNNVLFLPDIDTEVVQEFLRIMYCCHQYTTAWVQTHGELAKGLDILAALLDLDGAHIRLEEQFVSCLEESSEVQVKTEIAFDETIKAEEIIVKTEAIDDDDKVATSHSIPQKRKLDLTEENPNATFKVNTTSRIQVNRFYNFIDEMKNHPDAVKCPLCPEILLKKFLQDHIRLQHNQMSSVKNNVQPSIF